MKTIDRSNDRIVAKARFTSTVFVRDIIIGVLLGGIVGAIWWFNDEIENLIFQKGQPAIYLKDEYMRWVLIAVACLTLLLILIDAIRFASKKLYLTEDRLVYHTGVINVKSVSIPLGAIKSIETKQNPITALLGIGALVVISDAQKPYVIKGIVKAERFARRVMRQLDWYHAPHNSNVGQQLVSIRLLGPGL